MKTRPYQAATVPSHRGSVAPASTPFSSRRMIWPRPIFRVSVMISTSWPRSSSSRATAWRLVSPACTEGLIGKPNELKIKYLADNDFAGLSGAELRSAVENSIRHKDADLKGNMASQGTTPRQLTDLIGSLCDLTSGSGDKGTPVVFIQGYFDTYAEEE